MIADGKVYFAAGIWPFMGIFLHALDAETGEVRLDQRRRRLASTSSSRTTPIRSPASRRRALVVDGDKLLVPGGRSVPACYDRRTGRFLHYQLAENGKRGGGFERAAVDQLLFNGGAAFDLETENYLGPIGELVALRFTYRVLSPKIPIASGSGVCVFSMTPLPASSSEKSMFFSGSNS